MRIAVAADERTGTPDALTLSLRLTRSAQLREIPDAWFAAQPASDASDLVSVVHPADLEERAPSPRSS